MSSKATVKLKQKKEAQRLAALRKKETTKEEPAVFEGTVTNVNVDDSDEIVEEYVEESYTEEDLNNMLKADLMALAESLDLDSTGTKSEIIERILSV